MAAANLIVTTDPNFPKRSPLSYGAFMATEGGRKCPLCGKYAKTNELGFIGGRIPNGIVTAYGHLPGKGCNKSDKAE